MQYRNTGAPFSRGDGSVVNRGDVFDPTADELMRRRYKLKPVKDSVPSAAPSPVRGEEEPTPIAGWPLRMTPETYARLHPDGQYAELAKTIQQRDAEEP